MIDLGTFLDSGTVQLNVVLPATAERVWQFLTTPEGLRTWLAEGSIDPQRAHLQFGDTGDVIDAPVLRWEPPFVLEFEWVGGSSQASGSYVRFELVSDGDVTTLTLTHTKAAGDASGEFAAGWHRHLDLLDARVRGEDPAPNRPTYDALLERYAGRRSDA
ncbi:MAG: SRPBCC family protein [Nocardioidaceae bacterium]